MTGWILAQQMSNDKTEMLRHMGSRFEKSDPELYWKIPVVVFLLVLAVFLAWLLYTLQRWRQGASQAPQPMRLYLQAMHKIGLGVPDIWQLWRLAQRLQLKHPTALLISPLYFDKAAAADCCNKGGQVIHRARHHRLKTIRVLLFGQDAPVPS